MYVFMDYWYIGLHYQNFISCNLLHYNRKTSLWERINIISVCKIWPVSSTTAPVCNWYCCIAVFSWVIPHCMLRTVSKLYDDNSLFFKEGGKLQKFFWYINVLLYSIFVALYFWWNIYINTTTKPDCVVCFLLNEDTIFTITMQGMA